MAAIESRTIRKGLAADRPTLAVGELGLDTDTYQLWIGTAGGNVQIQNRVTNVSDTEIGYLNGVTSAIQTQINALGGRVKTITTGFTTIGTGGTRYIARGGSQYTNSGTQKIFVDAACSIKNLVVNGTATNTTSPVITVMYAANAGSASSATSLTCTPAFTSTTPNYAVDLNPSHAIVAAAGSWIEFRTVNSDNNVVAIIDVEFHYT